MDPTLVGILGIILMLAMFFTRMPVAYVMALVGFVGFSAMISVQGGSICFPEAFTRFFLPTD